MLYARNESFFNSDKIIYEKRAKQNFGLNDVLPYLSILTPSIPSRIENSLQKLIEKIDKQIKENNLEKKVEHLILIDNKIRTVGRKRDNLIQSAVGQFLAFVDDDDDISNDYVLQLTNAIKENPDVDVITFKQNCYIENYPKSVAIFGLENDNESYIPGSSFKRKPFHVCAWNKKIAQKYRVPSNNISEDIGWASQLWKEAKTEYFIDKALHAYIQSEANTACIQTGENSVYNNTQI
jgi:glycosyltransferase involved in cell wall biosynthesis